MYKKWIIYKLVKQLTVNTNRTRMEQNNEDWIDHFKTTNHVMGLREEGMSVGVLQRKNKCYSRRASRICFSMGDI